MRSPARALHAVLVVLVVIAVAAGCSHTTWVTVPNNPAAASSVVDGVSLLATGAAWDHEPDNLTDYVTVVAVQIVNQSAHPVRIGYADFTLTDDTGFRYAALNPYLAASAVGVVPPAPPRRALAAVDGERVEPVGVLIAARGRGFGARPFRARPFRGGTVYRQRVVRPRVVVVRRRASYLPRVAWVGRRPGLHGPWYVRPPVYRPRLGYYGGGWTGFVPGGALRPWYGAGFASYWGAPFLFGPSVYVWGWSGAHYPAPRPPDDVINLALPEGVLEPGGHLDGFLYFQQRQGHAQALALGWTVTDAQSNAPVGQARIDLAVVPAEL